MRGIIGFAFLLAVCDAQAADEKLTFEVASIRPVPDIGYPGLGASHGGPGTSDPGRLTYQHSTLKLVVMNAYDVQNYQVSGPSWMDSERYDIVAKIPAGTTKEQANVMLQNLLAERFKMALHRETKEFQVFELTVAKGGPKLKESHPASSATAAKPDEPMGQYTIDKDGLPRLPPGPPTNIRSGTMISARQQPISVLTSFLQGRMSLLGLPVLDKTGLAGTYDFALKFSTAGLGVPTVAPGFAAADAASDSEPDVFTAVQQYLGLKLDKKKDPLDVLVIDHAEKPSAN